MEENSFMASRDKERDQGKPAADLLRRSLASAAGAPGSDIDACPDPEILAAYSERSLDADETARYELHFSQCARCREQLAALVRADELAGTAKEKHSRVPGMRWIRTRNWDWRLLAPATAALMLVIIVATFRPTRQPVVQAPQPLVAMNQPAAPPAAPGSSPAAGAVARMSPSSNSVNSKAASPAVPREIPEKKQDQADSSLSLRGRNFKELDKVAKPAAAPKSGVSIGSGNAVGNGVAASSDSQSVTVEAAAAGKPAAPVPTAVAPPDISNSASAGAISPAPGAAAKSARSEQMSAAVSTNPSFARTESVMVQAGDETSARILVRTPDPQVLWRFSSGRFVERSSDAGATWRVQWTSPNAHLVAGAAPTTDSCWLVGRGGMILVTTDGRKWKTIAPPADADFVDVSATDASSATVTTTDDRKFTTSDSGKHWTPAP
jgi:hypothetical protein